MSSADNNEKHEVTKDQQVRDLIEEVMRRLTAGEEMSDDSLIEAHPELMPELAHELHKLRMIDAARRRAEKSGLSPASNEPEAAVHPDETLDQDDTGNREGHNALHIRCPHCHSP